MPDDVGPYANDPIDFETHVCVNYHPKKYRDSLSNLEFIALMQTICLHEPDKCLCMRSQQIRKQQVQGFFSRTKHADFIASLTRLALGTAKYLRTLLHEMEDREAWAFLETAIHIYGTCFNPDHPPHDATCQHDSSMFPTSVLLDAESRTKNTVVSLLRMRVEPPTRPLGSSCDVAMMPRKTHVLTEDEALRLTDASSRRRSRRSSARVHVLTGKDVWGSRGDPRLKRRSRRSKPKQVETARILDERPWSKHKPRLKMVRSVVDRPPPADIWDRRLPVRV